MASLSVRDPVHGFIRADALEAAVIGSRPLQRLRSVRQLGLTFMIFPGAEHSRFGHALGAMHLAGRVYDALAVKAADTLDPDPRAPARRLVRLAALVHDIGHAPFSHSAEELFENRIDHEEMTRRLLTTSELEAIFARLGHGIEIEQICRLLRGGEEGTERLLAQAISGELDVDKMDYLLRDSLFCGVRYGSFDLERLLDTIVALHDPETGRWGIGVEEGGVHALEALVMARYYMFTQVYFNTGGKVLELHLSEWLREHDLRWSADPERFLQQDDITVVHRMRQSGSVHARAVLERRHYLLAYETGEHLRSGEKRRFEALLAPLIARFGGSQLLVSNSAKDPHQLTHSRLLVRKTDGRLEPMANSSHFIRHLDRIDRYRVYCHPAIRNEVAAALTI